MNYRPDISVVGFIAFDIEFLFEVRAGDRIGRARNIYQMAEYLLLVGCDFSFHFGDGFTLLRYGTWRLFANAILCITFVHNFSPFFDQFLADTTHHVPGRQDDRWRWDS